LIYAGTSLPNWSLRLQYQPLRRVGAYWNTIGLTCGWRLMPTRYDAPLKAKRQARARERSDEKAGRPIPKVGSASLLS
jgi:hypothetical protein